MPQLEVVHIFVFFMWTWFTLYLTMKKIKALLMIKTPEYQQQKSTTKSSMTLPWA